MEGNAEPRHDATNTGEVEERWRHEAAHCVVGRVVGTEPVKVQPANEQDAMTSVAGLAKVLRMGPDGTEIMAFPVEQCPLALCVATAANLAGRIGGQAQSEPDIGEAICIMNSLTCDDATKAQLQVAAQLSVTHLVVTVHRAAVNALANTLQARGGHLEKPDIADILDRNGVTRWAGLDDLMIPAWGGELKTMGDWVAQWLWRFAELVNVPPLLLRAAREIANRQGLDSTQTTLGR